MTVTYVFHYISCFTCFTSSAIIKRGYFPTDWF